MKDDKSKDIEIEITPESKSIKVDLDPLEWLGLFVVTATSALLGLYFGII